MTGNREGIKGYECNIKGIDAAHFNVDGNGDRKKDPDYKTVVKKYARCSSLLQGDCLLEREKSFFRRKTVDIDDVDATLALN